MGFRRVCVVIWDEGDFVCEDRHVDSSVLGNLETFSGPELEGFGAGIVRTGGIRWWLCHQFFHSIYFPLTSLLLLNLSSSSLP